MLAKEPGEADADRRGRREARGSSQEFATRVPDGPTPTTLQRGSRNSSREESFPEGRLQCGSQFPIATTTYALRACWRRSPVRQMPTGAGGGRRVCLSPRPLRASCAACRPRRRHRVPNAPAQHAGRCCRRDFRSPVADGESHPSASYGANGAFRVRDDAPGWQFACSCRLFSAWR